MAHDDLAEAVADALVRAGDVAAAHLSRDRAGGSYGANWPAELEAWRDRLLDAYARYRRGEASERAVRIAMADDFVHMVLDWWREEVARDG